MKRFLRDEKGATSIEYALIAILVSVCVVVGATMIGAVTRSSFVEVSSGFTSR